ncbi:MAG TPA: M23 family metallopeptidase [Anaerolineaceae bacterium]|nr:M23 family metallopeptidase [Anaerolineaceae bacterium]
MGKFPGLALSFISVIIFLFLVACDGKSGRTTTTFTDVEENIILVSTPTTVLPTKYADDQKNSIESNEIIQIEIDVPDIENEEDSPNLVETPAVAEFEFSSPLQGIDIEELFVIESNPFDYAGHGKDEGHHGTDFSFYRYKSFEKIENLPIQSIFTGTIRSLVNNRPPYGNMIIIETPLFNLPEKMQQVLHEDYLIQNPPYHTNLNCPEIQMPKFEKDIQNLSIYVLYAHLHEFPGNILEQKVISGEKIGEVGNSGLSGNPHLHLEFRVGPSNYNFPFMAHYDNAATPDEISNYCLWRVSGYFSTSNPMDFFNSYLQNR